MVCCAPVVASNVSSIPEIAGGAALLVDPASPESIADAIRRVVLNPDVALSLREQGFRRAQDFSYATTAKETVAIYESVR